MWSFAIFRATDTGESSLTMPPTMPFRRQIHQHIDVLRHGPYIAAHEQVVIDCRAVRAPPPYRRGTDARPRVNRSCRRFRGTLLLISAREFGLSFPQAMDKGWEFMPAKEKKKKQKSACSAPPVIPARNWCGSCCAIRAPRSCCSPPIGVRARPWPMSSRNFRPTRCPSSPRSRAPIGRRSGSILLSARCRTARRRRWSRICWRARRAPRSSISRPISAWPIPPPMRAGTAMPKARPSCRRARSTG